MVTSRSAPASKEENQRETFEPRPIKDKPRPDYAERAKDIAERFPKTMDYLAK
ncbi:hypothetical protein FE840_009225 [Peteryoungia desertarenae]|uniref:Uncharacterized protein n=1 Tax=Peteryoungia desertarenae TaxID=1813451 RepID=A0ABX6QME8_9HYPH|nr:hypothetical protein [Peteryoungia desertarenae]QLF69708.1 hypothetical protein FE840_009225 [Peteryoungia desertarenae]